MRGQGEFLILLAVFSIALTATDSKGIVGGKKINTCETQLKVEASWEKANSKSV